MSSRIKEIISFIKRNKQSFINEMEDLKILYITTKSHNLKNKLIELQEIMLEELVLVLQNWGKQLDKMGVSNSDILIIINSISEEEFKASSWGQRQTNSLLSAKFNLSGKLNTRKLNLSIDYETLSKTKESDFFENNNTSFSYVLLYKGNDYYFQKKEMPFIGLPKEITEEIYS